MAALAADLGVLRILRIAGLPRPGARHGMTAVRPLGFADSLYLGLFAFVLTIASGVILFTWQLEPDHPLEQIGLFTWIIGAPALAFVNVWFALRDVSRGRRIETLLGAVLSGLCILIGWGSLLLAD